MWYIVVCIGYLSAVLANIYLDRLPQLALRQSGIARIGSKTTHRETRAFLQNFAMAVSMGDKAATCEGCSAEERFRCYEIRAATLVATALQLTQ